MNNSILPPDGGMQVCKCCGRELPVSSFARGGFGLLHICNECRAEKQRGKLKQKKVNEVEDLRRQLSEARALRLRDFQPRELMIELRKRGYEGTLTFVQRHEIDITKVD